MPFLEAFSDEEKEILTALPYRAGLWVSMADEKGGGSARSHELKCIKSVMVRLAEGMLASAFAHEVISSTYQQRDQWEKWALQTGTVPDDARQAVALIQSKLMPHDAESYVQMVMMIAYETAYAFREFDRSASIPIRIWVALKLIWEAFIRTGNRDYRIESVANISLAEEEAIAVLAESLRLASADADASFS